MVERLQSILDSHLHLDDSRSTFVEGVSALVVFLLTYLSGISVEAAYQFMAITIVVFGDTLTGIILAVHRREFQTRKLIRVVYYLLGYTGILVAMLSIERAYSGVFWLSESVMVPILIGQIISSLKNLHLAGLLNASVLSYIMANIDNHKVVPKDKLNSEQVTGNGSNQ